MILVRFGKRLAKIYYGLSWILQIYDENHGFKLNDVVEFYGIWSSFQTCQPASSYVK
jgi:hypothetical protein